MSAELSQLSPRQLKQTRKRMTDLIERCLLDLRLAGDCARACDEYAIQKLIARLRRELREANPKRQTARGASDNQ